MLALRFRNARLALDPRAPAPVLQPSEALITLRCALASPAECASPADAPGGTPPAFTPGRQFVGTVAALHEEAPRELRKRWEGKRVVGSVDVVCSTCDLCRAGLSTHCRARRTLGTPAWDGCLAQSFKLPVRNLVEIPAAVSDHAAVFAFMLSGALHAAQLVRVENKPYVTILGDSASALLCAQVMARLNASVRLLGKRQFALCEKWGIKHRCQSEVGRRQDQDIVIDCTGADPDSWGLSLAFQLARPRARVVLMPGRVPPVDLDLVVEHELQLFGARRGNIADAVAFLSTCDIDTASLITRRFPLAEAPRALEAAAHHDAIAVVVESNL